MQKTILVKRRGDKLPRQTAQIDYVSYREKTEVVGTILAAGFGNINTIRGTGKFDKSIFTIRVDNNIFSCPATHEGVKSVLRRLRQEEAVELDQIDAQLSALRERRIDLLKAAWNKGHVITVKELVDQIAA